MRRTASPRAHLRRLAFLGALAAGAGSLGAGVWIPAKAELAQWLMNRAWSETQADRRRVRPWPWADTWPVARLTLPASRAPLIVLAGASGRNLAFAPAHMDGSALPGHAGVSVIAGHRDTHFRALESLAAGDHFEIEQPDGQTYTYEIVAVDVVDAREASIRLDAEGRRVMLVTCYPFDAVTPGGPLRYVVTGEVRAPSQNGHGSADRKSEPARLDDRARQARRQRTSITANQAIPTTRAALANGSSARAAALQSAASRNRL